MTTNNSYHMTWKLRATIALVLALALSIFPAEFSRAVKAQKPANATAAAPTKATASTSGESRGGPKEGIKVHGHWTIDVRNPDGSLVSHQEFENDLQTSGAAALGKVFGRERTIGEWSVWLNNPVQLDEPCAQRLIASRPPSRCSMVEVNGGSHISDSGVEFKTLTVSVPTSGPNSSKLVLSGNATAGNNGHITEVYTQNLQCVATVLPADCLFSLATGAAALDTITSTSIAPVAVSTGQIIQVTVVISFS